MDVKMSATFNEETKYLHSLKVFSHKTLFNYKGKNNSFIAEKPDRYYLSQVAELTSSNK